ncbi:hypothetical protein LTR05_006959 [Lithohypha guttulata]|uniref:Uncharacterized protein n=1 Tax=Lithohypha guttulata TaxID=1690604 RepID=A0AAN7Y4V1_9EURO|nr:hypothetical protein LTR05_006959 [Lithohypha guttulata]
MRGGPEEEFIQGGCGEVRDSGEDEGGLVGMAQLEELREMRQANWPQRVNKLEKYTRFLEGENLRLQQLHLRSSQPEIKALVNKIADHHAISQAHVQDLEHENVCLQKSKTLLELEKSLHEKHIAYVDDKQTQYLNEQNILVDTLKDLDARYVASQEELQAQQESSFQLQRKLESSEKKRKAVTATMLKLWKKNLNIDAEPAANPEQSSETQSAETVVREGEREDNADHPLEI